MIHHSKQVATGHTPHPFRLAFALLIGLPTRAIAMLYRIRTKLRSHHKLSHRGFPFISQSNARKRGQFLHVPLENRRKRGQTATCGPCMSSTFPVPALTATQIMA